MGASYVLTIERSESLRTGAATISSDRFRVPP